MLERWHLAAARQGKSAMPSLAIASDCTGNSTALGCPHFGLGATRAPVASKLLAVALPYRVPSALVVHTVRLRLPHLEAVMAAKCV